MYGNMLGFEQEKDRGLEKEKEKEKEDLIISKDIRTDEKL